MGAGNSACHVGPVFAAIRQRHARFPHVPGDALRTGAGAADGHIYRFHAGHGVSKRVNRKVSQER